MPKNKNDNLIPIKTLSNEEAKARGAKGGKASVEARRKRKAFKDVFNTLLTNDLSPELAEALNDKSGALSIDTKGFTVNDYMALAQVVKAIGGDTKAFEVIRDTVGEKPVDKAEVKTEAFRVVIENADD